MPPRPPIGPVSRTSTATLRHRSRIRNQENRAALSAAENQMDPALLNPVGSTPGRDDFNDYEAQYSGSPGKPPYDDAILREARKRKNKTSVARTGIDQPNTDLRFPLEKTEYRAEIIFSPMRPKSIIEDLQSALSTKSEIQSPDPEPSFPNTPPPGTGSTVQVDPVQDAFRAHQNIEARANRAFQARERGADDNDANQFEGRDPSFQVKKGAPKGSSALMEPIGSTCRLYLPQAITIADGVQVGPIDLGVVGAATEDAINMGMSDAKALAVNALQNTDITSILDVFRNGDLQSTAGAFAAQRAAKLVGSQGVAGAIARGTQVQVNPNTRSLFRSVNIREFAFTFKMIASSSDEAGQIKAIIEFFRKELYPEEIRIGTDANINASFAYRMPNLFGIKMLYRDNHTIATRIKPCYLRNFSAVYNPGGMGIHNDGNFIETDITMSFVEHTTLSRADINEGF